MTQRDDMGAVGHAGIDNGLGETSGNKDYNQIHGLGKLVNAAVTGLAIYLLTVKLGIHAIELAFITGINNVVEYHGAEFCGISGHADYCNALRIEE